MDDCMAELRAYLPACDATRIHRKLDGYARAAAGPDDRRTHAQRRAARFTAATLIQVPVPATPLMGLDEQSGDLAGYGPITADQVRQIAANDATWKRILA